MVKQLYTKQAIENLIETNKTCMILKHSLTCPISANAYDVYQEFADHTEIPLYIVHIQEARELSEQISEVFDIKHESPQVLYVNNGEVAWHASHFDISRENLMQAVRG